MKPGVKTSLDLASKYLVKAEVGEIPEVARAIVLMERLARAHWKKAVSTALETLDDALDRVPLAGAINSEDRETALDEILLSLFLLFRTAVDLPLTPKQTSTLRDLSEDLVRAGATERTGLLYQPASARILAAFQAAEVEFREIFLWHFDRARVEVERLLRVFLISPEARSISGFPSGVADAQDSFGRAGWRKGLEKAIDATGDRFLPFAVDAWAFRTYVTGLFEGALAGGAVAIEIFNNPPVGPDHRTSLICFAIHGTIIPIDRAAKQIDDYRNALLRRDYEEAERIWPLIRIQPGDTQESLKERISSRTGGLGLPPYHGRCRTRPLPVFE